MRAALALPLLLTLVFWMHLRSLARLLDFQLAYTPPSAEATVKWLVAHGPQAFLLHDPHVIAYLVLPLFLVVAQALRAGSRDRHPLASRLAHAVTVVGTIYLGGLFGMWTAFYDGLAHVDASQIAGATATFAAMTAPRGAFLLTTTLAKLAFVGLALQGLLLWGRDLHTRIAAVAIGLGSLLFLAFWDLDNWMFVGSVLMLIGIASLLHAPAGAQAAAD